jgi:hypothetical protein
VQSENPELGEFVLNRLSIALVNGNWLRVVERNAATLERIDQEMERHLDFYVSDETKLSIGRQLGAEVIISGSFTRTGQNWRLDIQAVNVESTERRGHFLRENIRSESAWGSIISGRSVGLSFEGDIPGVRERHTITAGLRQAMEVWNIDLELNENIVSGTGYSFSMNIFLSQTPSGLLEAEVTITFLSSGRLLQQNSPYIIRETSDVMISRRIAEHLRRDQVFFNRVNNAIR